MSSDFDQARSRDWFKVVRRSVAELLVITVGVLIALAADRWNQSRELRTATSVYIERLAEEIRADSVEAALVVASLPEAWSVRDQLLAAWTDGAPLPEERQEAMRSSILRYNWRPPVAWTELNNTGLLGSVEDLELRRAVSEYYAVRTRYKTFLDGAERRGRDPYADALYPLGWMEGEMRARRDDAFRQWPKMDDILIGLGGHFSLLGTFAPLIERDAGIALQHLDAARAQP